MTYYYRPPLETMEARYAWCMAMNKRWRCRERFIRLAPRIRRRHAHVRSSHARPSWRRMIGPKIAIASIDRRPQNMVSCFSKSWFMEGGTR